MKLLNPQKWLAEFKAASAARDALQLHQLRIDVLDETKALSLRGEYEAEGQTVRLEAPPKSTVYSEEILLSQEDTQDGLGRANITVVNQDCLEVARELAEKMPLVLNMASRRVPGGGAESGAGAQEECLFRSSNYFQALYPLRQHYPLDKNFGGIYSPAVTVFRGLEADGYPLLAEPFKVNFVAVAGLNRPPLTADGHLTEQMRQATERKIRTILSIAVLHKQKTLVLSALGCGAFRNPPEDIARIFKEQLSQKPYCEYFETVIFAIKGDHNDRKNSNFKAFAEAFAGA